MATLRLTISGVSGTRTIPDDKATVLANIIFDNLVLPSWPPGTPVPTTAQDRLQAVVDRIAVEIRDTARGCRLLALRAEQDAATRAELAAIEA